MSLIKRRVLDRKNAIRAGFTVVLALGLFSTIEAARIQRSLSAATADIYRQHLEQDEVRFELRRVLWLATSAARDYLLNPAPDREASYARQVYPLRQRGYVLLSRLDQIPEFGELRNRFDEFWVTVENVSRATAGLDAESRYKFVQREVAPRRNYLGDLLREWDALGKVVLHDSQKRFDASRQFAASRLFWILGLSLLTAAAVALFSLRYSENLELQAISHHQQVVHAKDELARLSTRLMEIQERERAHLARELHDEIGQGLATLRLEVARAEALPQQRLGEIKERLGRARSLSDSIVQNVRDICLFLRPSMLDDLGLIPAVQWLAQDFETRTGVRCEFSTAGVSDDLPEPVRTCVYRVVQESLHNCDKHAEATLVSVQIRQAGRLLTAAIQDNGRGFLTGAAKAGRQFGLMGMRERALSAGGTLSISSNPGQGTCVELIVPVEPSADRRVHPEIAVEA